MTEPETVKKKRVRKPLSEEQKQKARERSARWRAANPEKARIDRHDPAKAKAYSKKLYKKLRAANPEKFRARWQAHYEKNVERLRAEGRRRYAANPGPRRESQRNCYVRNKEVIEVRRKRWRKNNPEKYRAQNNKRRAMKVGATIGSPRPIWEWERKWKSKKLVRCFWCQEKFQPSLCHADHIIPLSRGGSHEVGNLCVACQTCNTQKHAKSLAEWNTSISNPVLF